MPFGAIGAYTCQRLQANMVDYYKKNLPQFRTLGSTSLIKWLLSPQNTANFKKIDVQSIPGKKRGVAFHLETPFCLELCSMDVDCNTTMTNIQPSTKEMVFDLTDNPYRVCDGDGDPMRLYFDAEDMMKYCTETDQSFIQRQILRFLLEWEEALDKKLTAMLAGVVGTNAAEEGVTNLPIFVNNSISNTSALNPDAQWYLQQLYSDLGLDGNFGMIGGNIVNKIAQFNKWACCNHAGVDLSKADATNPWVFYNRNFNATFGASDFLIMAPGAAQLVTWNRYKGEKAKSVTELYTHDTVVLPTTGLEVDYQWYYDYKCEKWTFDPFLHLELAVAPPGGCTDNLDAVNGIVRVHECGSVPLQPTCPAPSEE